MWDSFLCDVLWWRGRFLVNDTTLWAMLIPCKISMWLALPMEVNCSYATHFRVYHRKKVLRWVGGMAAISKMFGLMMQLPPRFWMQSVAPGSDWQWPMEYLALYIYWKTFIGFPKLSCTKILNVYKFIIGQSQYRIQKLCFWYTCNNYSSSKSDSKLYRLHCPNSAKHSQLQREYANNTDRKILWKFMICFMEIYSYYEKFRVNIMLELLKYSGYINSYVNSLIDVFCPTTTQ